MKTIQRIALSLMMFILTNCATTNYSEHTDMIIEQNKSEANDTIANSGHLISDDFQTNPIFYNRNNSECETCKTTMDETNEE